MINDDKIKYSNMINNNKHVSNIKNFSQVMQLTFFFFNNMYNIYDMMYYFYFGCIFYFSYIKNKLYF